MLNFIGLRTFTNTIATHTQMHHIFIQCKCKLAFTNTNELLPFSKICPLALWRSRMFFICFGIEIDWMHSSRREGRALSQDTIWGIILNQNINTSVCYIQLNTFSHHISILNPWTWHTCDRSGTDIMRSSCRRKSFISLCSALSNLGPYSTGKMFY